MSTVLLLAFCTVFLLIVSILFFPQITIRNRCTIKIYPWIPLFGGFFIFLSGGIPWSAISSAFLSDSSVNPIRILILFFSMTVFSLILEQTGFFEHVSGVILKKSGDNQYKIFLSFYAIISFLTIFTSNDIVILTFTPFICHFCKMAKIDPIPYLIMEFVAANTWSLFLLIGNPTNIYISGAFNIGFLEYIGTMALPTVAAGISSLLIMLLLFRKKLHGKITSDPIIKPITDLPLMWLSLLHLFFCVILLAISQYIRFEMWLIAFFMALSVLICAVVSLLIRKKSLLPVQQAMKKMPYELIPFIVGMFIIVLALDENQVTYQLAEWLKHDTGVFSFGLSSFFASNVLNNIPMSVLFSKILRFHATSGQIYATIIGSNLGAFVTPIGALAGIMWLNLLKQNKVSLPISRFIFFGIVIGVPSVLMALSVLQLLG